MAKPYITKEYLKSADGVVLQKFIRKHQTAFARLEGRDFWTIVDGFMKVPYAARGQMVEMETQDMGYGKASEQEQGGLDYLKDLLSDLQKDRKALMEREASGERSAVNELAARISLARTYGMIEVARLGADAVVDAAEINKQTEWVKNRAVAASEKLAKLGSDRTAGELRARTSINAIMGTLAPNSTQISAPGITVARKHLTDFGTDEAARNAYINGLTARGVDVVSTVRLTMEQEAVGETPGVGITSAELEVAESKREDEGTEYQTNFDLANDVSTAMATIFGNVGVSSAALDRIKKAAGFPNPDAPKLSGEAQAAEAKEAEAAVDYYVKEYESLRDRQLGVMDNQPVQEWAHLEQKMLKSVDFMKSWREEGQGKTMREHFEALSKGVAQVQKDEQEAADIAEEEATGLSKLERIADGQYVDASTLQRIVARMRVAGNKAGAHLGKIGKSMGEEIKGSVTEQKDRWESDVEGLKALKPGGDRTQIADSSAPLVDGSQADPDSAQNDTSVVEEPVVEEEPVAEEVVEETSEVKEEPKAEKRKKTHTQQQKERDEARAKRKQKREDE